MPKLALRSLAASLLLAFAPPLRAQEDQIPESEHPGSDSPEAVTAAHARAGAGRRRAQAFLIPLDEKARGATARVAESVERVLTAKKQFDVIDLAKALASDAEPELAAKASEGRRLRAEADKSFEARNYSEAVFKYKAAIKTLQAGVASLEAQELSEAMLRLATSQLLAGDKKGARDSFLAAAVLDPQQRLSARNVDPAAEGPLKLARADAESVPIGTLEVQSIPTGARVFVDGVAHGTSPVRIEPTGGKHIVRLERTGFYPSAEVVEVTSRRDTVYSITLLATPDASQVNQLIAGAAEEASRGKPGDRCAALADRFHLERILVGSVSTHGLKAAVLLALYDAARHVLVGKDDLLLTADGTDADQVEADIQAATSKLLAADDEATARQGSAAGDGGEPAPAQTQTTAPAASAPPPRSAPPPASVPPPSASYGGMFGTHGATPPIPPAPPASDAPRKPVIPGAAAAAPTPDEPGLVKKERRVAIPPPPPIRGSGAPAPATPAAAASPAGDHDRAQPAEPASLESLRPDRKEKAGDSHPAEPAKKKDKDKDKGIKGKSGTEGWDDQ
jgi:hypothetical protein